MINWIKYLPFDLRGIEPYQKQPSPRGPSFDLARTKRYRIGGSELSFKAPRHRPSHSYYIAGDASSFNDALEYQTESFNRNVMPNEHWRYISILYRTWGFFGPWLTGAQYQLRCAVSLITPTEADEEVSFFHPKAFEHALADYLTSLYGHDTYSDVCRWRAPVNWAPRVNLPIPSVVFDVMPSNNSDTNREQLFCFPVTDRHILKVALIHELYSHNMNIARKDLKQYFDIKPMETLANQIIDSFQFKLSPEIQAQFDKVKAECPDMRLSESFAPLKWTQGEQAEETPHAMIEQDGEQ